MKLARYAARPLAQADTYAGTGARITFARAATALCATGPGTLPSAAHCKADDTISWALFNIIAATAEHFSAQIKVEIEKWGKLSVFERAGDLRDHAR